VDSLESARAAAGRLLVWGAGAVLVTLGERGVLACGGAGAAHFPAFPVEAVDTTAAGDAFEAFLRSLGGSR
jgi:ribokinase